MTLCALLQLAAGALLECFAEQIVACAGVWEMAVMGKNGVTVQGTLYTPVEGQPATGIPLHSQDYIQIGDKAFLLPAAALPGQARRLAALCRSSAPPALKLALTTRCCPCRHTPASGAPAVKRPRCAACPSPSQSTPA